MPQYTEWFQLTTTTTALNTCASYIGWGVAALFMGPAVEAVGRKGGVVMSVILKLIGIALMAGAHNVLMFVIGRIILGWGTGTAAIGASTWLAETLPSKIRGLGLSITYSVYFVGALMASGVCIGTEYIDDEWSWRIPCLLQSIFSIGCVCVLWFTPESPRWLAYHGRVDESLKVLASIYADGDASNTQVLQEHKAILDQLNWERNKGKKLTYSEIFRTRNAYRRVALAMSVAIIGMMSGNNIVSYYLGDMLNGAGIYDDTTQLQINVILNAWSLVCSLIGTYSMDKAGRKTLCLIACIGMTISLFLVGALTKLYGTGENLSGAYANVAMIFVFQGFYSVGITPITQLYPPEVMNYSIRTNGMALWAFCVTATGLFTTFVFPFGFAAIGWIMYMINAAYDVLQIIYVALYWVETKGLTLEEIDNIMDRIKKPAVAVIDGIPGDAGSQLRSSKMNMGAGVKEMGKLEE
ncbi:hypothetical protein PFICI_11804 [Pestalotiopsis fici W106-1]|uniref:Major facilitator superfamily (MFS) profile domain-containing protein n=1 Tax=Pestalotiopsis fici (strain W106-1 / CGMCC3.15140) TaxID=1229662 RepID=W3WTD7_PESFW|nr:uncharacterized protein PFICI_11804 [Pestalotiopsis fici W106-1]ETS76417.1 hypothetical protein PFICI_11804 [Pestalotiopsis fici W106-1]